MGAIEFLEHGGGHFHVLHRGKLIALPDPRSKHYQWVLMMLSAEHVPGTPDDIPDWKRSLAFVRYCSAWDLPGFQDARRLAYLVDNYRAPLAHDFATRTHHDLGNLWRERRWVLMLDIIDRLPSHSWYSSAVAMDEEHAAMMAASIAARKESGQEAPPSGPALTNWTPEVAALTQLLDAVRGVQYAVVAVQAGKKAGEPPKPAPRPVTPLEKALKTAEYNRRKSAHEDLVARVLPGKRRAESPVH